MYNDKQLKAINSLEGKIRVIAGAGSGKTATLTQRYAKLIESGIKPYNILCVTFTNKAAREMKERIEKNVGNLSHAMICTFHSFCLRLLRENIEFLGFPKDFAVLDSEDQKKILKTVYKECKIDYEVIDYKEAFAIISAWKIQKEYGLDDFIKKNENIRQYYEEAKSGLKKAVIDGEGDQQELIKKCIYYGYLYNQQKIQGLDFNDLIIFAVTLLKSDKAFLAHWQDKLHFIMVDEFQDASDRQFELVQMLGEKHQNIFIVGDPDQTIYTWRGAKPELLVNFDENRGAQTIIMNENYRSTPNILNAANLIIAKNTLRVEKDLFTSKTKGDKIIHMHSSSMFNEGRAIVRKIKELHKTYKYSDMAVLYRMHFLSRQVEESLIKANIPYKIFSGVNFYERKEVKDVMAYLSLLVNFHNDVALERIVNVPTRGIGDKKLEEMHNYAEENACSLWEALQKLHPYWGGKARGQAEKFILDMYYLKQEAAKEGINLSDFVREILNTVGYADLLKFDFEEERKANVDELLNAIEENFQGSSLIEFVQSVALMSSEDSDNKQDCVTLMTIHSAKGLEFPVVFVCGLSEGYLPSGRAATMEQVEEERRLAYVAYTRAKEKLILSDSEGKGFSGEMRETSRFITELPKSSLEIIEEVEYVPQGFKPWRMR